MSRQWPATAIKHVKIERVLPYAGNSRLHPPEQINQIAASMNEWGFTNPLLVRANEGENTFTVIAGHGRLEAAKKLNFPKVPVMVAEGWTDDQVRAYVIADNKIAENADWDNDRLAMELVALTEADFELDLLGFDSEPLGGLEGGDSSDFDLGPDPEPEQATEGDTEPTEAPCVCPDCGNAH